jgi:hypothetical protein
LPALFQRARAICRWQTGSKAFKLDGLGEKMIAQKRTEKRTEKRTGKRTERRTERRT